MARLELEQGTDVLLLETGDALLLEVLIPGLITPPTLALVLTTFIPIVSIPILVTPSTLSLNLVTYAPTVLVPRLITPPTLALVLTTFTPIVSIPILVTPSTLAIILTGYTPAVLTSRLITPSTLALVLTFYSPYLIIPELIAALTYVLEVHDNDGDLVNFLQNAYDIVYTEIANEAPTLVFKIPTDDDKVADIIRPNEIWLRNYKTGVLKEKFLISLRQDVRA